MGAARVGTGSSRFAGSPQAHRARYMPWAAVALVTLAATAIWFWKPKPSRPLLQMEITAPEGNTLGRVEKGQLALSPDGRQLAFIATARDGKSRLWLRALDSGKAAPVPGTEDVGPFPFWSPDSRWLAFNVHGTLEKSDVVAGGAPQLICECAVAMGTWNSDGIILTNGRNAPIQRVSAAGGHPTPVFDFDRSRGEHWMGAPNFLPDGKHFVYGTFTPQSSAVLASLAGKKIRSPALSRPGIRLLCTRLTRQAGAGCCILTTGNSLARPFGPSQGSSDRGIIAGGEFTQWEDPGSGVWAFTFFTSANGILAFCHWRANQSQLSWFNREGNPLSSPFESGILNYPRISPDQKTVAFVRIEDRKQRYFGCSTLPETHPSALPRSPKTTAIPYGHGTARGSSHSSVRGNERWIVGTATGERRRRVPRI